MTQAKQTSTLASPNPCLNRARASLLIYLSCILYSAAYLGRYSYAANLYYIMDDLSVEKDVAGLVSSFFFFSYAAGQLLNSIFAKYYRPRMVAAVALCVSAFCNLGIGLSPNTMVMRPIWLVNGLAQSLLWCCILNVQSKYLCQSDIRRAIVWNSMTIAFGTCTCYGLTALFQRMGVSWRVLFYCTFAVLFFVSFAWWFVLGKLERNRLEQCGADTQIGVPSASKASPTATTASLFTRHFMAPFVLACIAAATCAFIRDGIVTWLPTILIDDFGVPPSLSTVLTMVLPLISLLGAITVQALQRKIHGNMRLEALFFIIATIAIGSIVLLYSARLAIATLLLFTLMYFMLMAISNITTSVIPFSCRDYGNVGGISALLDSCCYLGSMISTYSLGYVSKRGGWMQVMFLITAVAAMSSVLCAIASWLAKKDSHTSNIL